MKCPKCGSENCQYVTTSEVHSRGFGFSNACCGTILMGPIGLLCGFCGMGTDTEVKEYWVCHECGNKFTGNEIQEKVLEKVELKFFLEESSELVSQDERWNFIKEGYTKYIQGKSLGNSVYFTTPTDKNEIFKNLKEEFVKDSLGDTLVYFAVLEGKGVLVTTRGLYVEDYLVTMIQKIIQYKNQIYLNKTCINLDNETNALQFLQFISHIYPDIPVQSYSTYEDVLSEVMECSGAGVPTKNSHFSSQDCYAEYVSQLSQKVEKLYEKIDFEGYQTYCREKKKRKILNIILWIIMIIIGISSFGNGEIFAVICIGIMFVIYMAIVTSERWEAYTKLLPEEIHTLLDENNKISKKGNINPKQYKKIVEELSVKTGSVKCCPNCGQKLEKEWKFCPRCYKEE